MSKQIENKAWFLSDDGRCPQTLYVMYDHSNNKPWDIDFKQGRFVGVDKIVFNVRDTKWGKEEHILKWDFLPNSTGISLANGKALVLLEDIAYGQFQAIPTELRMPDGNVITEYSLINVLHSISSLNEDRCILKPERFRKEWSKYETYYHFRNCLNNLHIAIDNVTFLGSETLRKAVKAAKLTGLTFRDSYAGCHFFTDEYSPVQDQRKK